MLKVGEARALYTLGNIYHLKGKQASQNAAHDLAEMPAEARTALQEAVNFYEYVCTYCLSTCAPKFTYMI